MTVLPAIKQGLWGNDLWTIRFQKWTDQASLQTPTPHITNCSGYSSAGIMGQNLSCHNGKGWANPVLMSTTGKCVTGKVRLQFWVGVWIMKDVQWWLWWMKNTQNYILHSFYKWFNLY
jgi:hypothetical protein